MAEPFWRVKFRGTPIRLSVDDLTAQRLRQMKQWFGPEYAIPTEFIRLLLLGETDALACAVWIGLQKVGKPLTNKDGSDAPTPLDLDFSFSADFKPLEDPKPKGKAKENPTPDPDTTPDG